MLKRIGITEIFQPKSHPGFRSASIDYSEDQHLTLSPSDLEVMNRTDWYGDPSEEAWEIANRHFDVLFFILVNSAFVPSMARHYKGAAIWRVYGREIEMNYEATLQAFTRGKALDTVRRMGDRFFFGTAYSHLHEIEPEYIQRQAVYLPLGLHKYDVEDRWEGKDKKILFVCPDIEGKGYYAKVYEDFYRDFGDLPHIIGGSQVIASSKPNVLGFVSNEEYDRIMRQTRVMYYHSLEPNHIHYHPFEAIRAGMPLVFRADGLLDRLGGKSLPGRARSISEARRKISRILSGDKRLIESIRSTQSVMLEDMKPHVGEPHWRAGMEEVLRRLQNDRSSRVSSPKARRRVAVILPLGYRGGTLRATKLVTEALLAGSRSAGEDVQVILAYPDDEHVDADFAELPKEILLRPYGWRRMSAAEAKRAMAYAGDPSWKPAYSEYLCPADGISNLTEADVWVIISHRFKAPVVPVRPVVIINYDYLLRYFRLWDDQTTREFIRNDWLANRVLVTTETARSDAIQFAGLLPSQVVRVPVLIPAPPSPLEFPSSMKGSILWVTNLGPHKNHLIAAQALEIYYSELQGSLPCSICGTGTSSLTDAELPHLYGAAAILKRLVRGKKVRIRGELTDPQFQEALARASFVWHPANHDNGTFTVVEAAQHSVPSLSSDYPAMREMDHQLGLNLTYCNGSDARSMAESLLWMQLNLEEVRGRLPGLEALAKHTPAAHGQTYWKAVSEWS